MNIWTSIKNFRDLYAPRGTQILLLILVVLIPFSIRYVFQSPIAYQTGAYSDFTSLSLYISDLILLGLLCLSILFHMKQPVNRIWLISAFGAISWILLEIIFQNHEYVSLQVYFSARFILLILLASQISKINVPREKLAWIFSILGAIQGLIACFQFYSQKSLGLYFLGESHLSPDTLGVAKIVAHGTKMIRGYGTFPHPNVLSAFLIVTTLLNLYLITKSIQKSRDIFLYILLFANVFGIFTSFSRGGIIGFGLATLSVLVIFLINKQYSAIKRAIIPLGISCIISVTVLFPCLNTGVTITDNSTKERLYHNEIGTRIISNNIFTGVGIGTSVLHMKQYSNQELQPWEVQPIHNYWLILWAEWGIGAICPIILLLYPIFALIKRESTIWRRFLIGILAGFMTVFLLDHYFYTIWQTQLLLWIILGLVLREIKETPAETTAPAPNTAI